MIAWRSCPVCSVRTRSFAPLPAEYGERWESSGFPYTATEFETLNARAYSCRTCAASDRDRLYALWIDRRAPARGKLLDVGPSRPLEHFLRDRFEYVSLDMVEDADVRGDVQRLSYPDGAFDAVICSHVLEHVDDDRQALAELRRVLRAGGWGIVMAPICLATSAVDEGGAADENAAWRRFGQGDHVRLYNSAGFLQRVRGAGFAVDEWRPALLDRLRYGLANGTVLYVVS